MASVMMDRYNGPALTACPVAKPEGKRLRRKLQKFSSHQHRNYLSNNADAKGRIFDNDAFQPRKYSMNETVPTSPTSPPAQPCLPLPANLSDGKWLDQFQKSGYLSPEEPSVRFAEPPRPYQVVSIIPELAHLSIEPVMPRNLSNQAAGHPPPAPSLKSSAMRRYAKTPVFRIGQLECPPGRDHNTVQKISSVELIAESYKALLESRCVSPDEPAALQPSPLRMGQSFDDALAVRREGKVPETPPMTESPTSDDGTLVAFEEDAIYFKPVSFSTDSPPPHGGFRQPELPPSPVQTPDSPSLQICLDLLTRELSAAAAGSLLRPSAETSALQIWVMIEAYERLRDQVHDMQLEKAQGGAMEAMLDMWLRALYEIHDKMTGRDGRMSESDYGELESEDLD